MNLKEIKAQAVDKQCQGDVNVYRLKGSPFTFTEGTDFKSKVLVEGRGGNTHHLTGVPAKLQKLPEGGFIMELFAPMSLAHRQHGTLKLKKGVYLIDQAREKGMFDDMIAPVVD